MILLFIFFICINAIGFIYGLLKHILSFFGYNIVNNIILIILFINGFISIAFILTIYNKLKYDYGIKFDKITFCNLNKKFKKIIILIFLYSVIFYFLIWLNNFSPFFKYFNKISPPIHMGIYLMIFSELLSLIKEKEVFIMQLCSNNHVSNINARFCHECGRKTKKFKLPFYDVKKAVTTLIYYIKNYPKYQYCQNNHLVSVNNKFCETCGVKIKQHT